MSAGGAPSFCGVSGERKGAQGWGEKEKGCGGVGVRGWGEKRSNPFVVKITQYWIRSLTSILAIPHFIATPRIASSPPSHTTKFSVSMKVERR